MLCGPPSFAIALVSAMPAARDTEVGRRCGRRRLGADVQHVDDAAPFARLHARPDQPAEADRGEQFEVEVFLPDLVGHGLERHRARGSGIVDEDVDRAEIGDDLVVGFGNIGGLRDVADIVANLDAVLGEALACGLQVRRAARQHRDLGARLGKSPGHRKPDPLAAAGDDGNAVLHCYVPFLPPWVRQLRAAPCCSAIRSVREVLPSHTAPGVWLLTNP